MKEEKAVQDLLMILINNGRKREATLIEDLVSTKTVQRLKDISYLASIPLAFKGISDFSRWDHSIGTTRLLAEVIIVNKTIGEEDACILLTKGLLHDIGLVCFSHIGESVLQRKTGSDHHSLRNKMIYSSEISEILRKFNLFISSRVEDKWRPILDSHLDCDTLDGIARTACILGMQPVNWVEVLPRVLRWSDNEWTWSKDAITDIIAHWNMKKIIYERVYSEQNQSCEATIEAILDQLDPKAFFTEAKIKEGILSKKDTKELWSGIQEGHFYRIIPFEAKLPFQGYDNTIEIAELESWKGVVKNELVSIFSLNPDSWFIRCTQVKTFESLSREDFKNQINKELRITYEALESVLIRKYRETRQFNACIAPAEIKNVSQSLIEKITTWTPKTSVFRCQPLALEEAEVLWNWVTNFNTNLHLGKEVTLEDGHVVQLKLDMKHPWKRDKTVSFDTKDLLKFPFLEKLELTTNNEPLNYLSSMASLERLELSFSTRDNGWPGFLSTNDISLSKLKDLTIDVWGDARVPEGISKCTQLHRLRLHGSSSIFLPEGIGNLPHLKELEVRAGYGEDVKLMLPDTLDGLSSLETLILERGVDILPDSLTSLEQLKILIVTNTRIKTLPAKSYNLSNLVELDLSRNRIRLIPENIFTKTKTLAKINLSSNEIETLPTLFGIESSLKKIDVSYNKLTRLPDNDFTEKNQEEKVDGQDDRLTEAILDEVPELRTAINYDSIHPRRDGEVKPMPMELALTIADEFICRGNPLLEFPTWIRLEDITSGDVGSSVPVRVPLLQRRSYSKREQNHSSWVDDKMIANYIHPLNMILNNPEYESFFTQLFERSINHLTNVHEFIEAYLVNPPAFEPYLLMLGIRAIESINSLLATNPSFLTPERSLLLKTLENQLTEADARQHAIIAFIPIFPQHGSITPPMGVLGLAGILVREGYSRIVYSYHYSEHVSVPKNESFNFPREDILEKELSQKVKGTPLLLIGPVFTCYLPDIIQLTKKLRLQYPDGVILAGGPHFGAVPDMDSELLELCLDLDGIIVGEAEETIIDVARAFSLQSTRNGFLKAIKENPITGLRFRDAPFTERPIPKELDEFPIPYFKLLTSSHLSYSLCDRRNPYLTTNYYVVDDAYGGGVGDDDVYLFINDHWNRSVAGGEFPFSIINGSRGCPFKCTFCASKTNYRRLKSAAKVFEEIYIAHKRFKTREFVFFDPLFTTKSKLEQRRIRDLCSLLITTGLHEKIRFQIDVRCDVILGLEPDMLPLLVRAGCHVINIGLEKGSNKALERIDKLMQIEDHRNAIKIIREASFKMGKEVLINGTFIFGGKDETLQDIKETIIHAFTLDLDGIAMFPLEIHPGTEDYYQSIKDGVLEPGIKPYLSADYPLYHTVNVPSTLLQEIGTSTKKLLDDHQKMIRSALHSMSEESNGPLESMLDTLNIPPSIQGFSTAYLGHHVVIDAYARTFLKKIRRELVNAMKQGLIPTSGNNPYYFGDIFPNIQQEINNLEGELQARRSKNYHRNPNEYQFGSLKETCSNILRSFIQIALLLDKPVFETKITDDQEFEKTVRCFLEVVVENSGSKQPNFEIDSFLDSIERFLSSLPPDYESFKEQFLTIHFGPIHVSTGDFLYIDYSRAEGFEKLRVLLEKLLEKLKNEKS